VNRYAPLYELDTDKVTQEVEADISGVLLKIIVSAGEVQVGRTVAYIGQDGEPVPGSQPEGASETSGEALTHPPPSHLRPSLPGGRALHLALAEWHASTVWILPW
jgi:pyruvate/2-oxoglutarate dehydrogenase complex dihydrolipoamide acyltransferase (E2) component